MLLISGERSDYHLIEKINARDDKYMICETINYHMGKEALIEKIHQYDAIIVGDIPSHERNVIIKYCFDHSIRTYSVPKISDILLRSSDELNLFDTPLLLSRNMGLSIEQQFVKRVIDIIGSMIGIIITIPFFIVIGLSIKLTDHGPVFYTQTRLTKDGRPFKIYKFRTMIQNAEKDGVPRLAAEGDPRILPVGRLLRATRLDELPQVLNILKGDMSIVGPRPERPELVEEFTNEIPEFPDRMKVKAGLTGYAQVYGKYNTTPYDKLKFDLMYINTGAMYRAVALMAERKHIKPEEVEKLVKLVDTMEIHFENDDLVLNGINVQEEITMPEISAIVSNYASIPEVRSKLVQLQRNIAEKI